MPSIRFLRSVFAGAFSALLFSGLVVSAPVQSQARTPSVASAPPPPVAPDPVFIRQEFSNDPLTEGWEHVGNPALHVWNPGRSALDVTWDSSYSNTYLRVPLGTVLTRRDDFSVALDLTLRDIVAGNGEDKPGTFQIAFGFQNRADALKPGFIRGTGDQSPNLVEFNFFPDTGYGPTVWPAVFPTNGLMNYSGAGDFSILDLPTGIPMRITLAYSATTGAASITITTNGIPVGPATSARLSARFTAFEVDSFSISSYSDAGQRPFMPGSVLAHGEIDNIVIAVPPPPIRGEHGAWLGGRWEHSFLSVPGWSYVLETSLSLDDWSAASLPQAGTGGILTLTPASLVPERHRFFRVHATRNP